MKVMTDDSHYTAIADALREQIGADDASFAPHEMADAIVDVCGSRYGEGYGDASAECAAQHFVHTFVGDGSGSVSVNIPFEPDKIFLVNMNPLVQFHTNEVALLSADLRAFGRNSGFAALGLGSSLGFAGYTTKTFPGARYSRAADGTVTLRSLQTSTTNSGVFTSGVTFLLIAIKHLEQTDKELITEFVEGLTGSGTVEINKAKVDANFTSAEWSALIATKPGWTFTMYS